MNRIIISIVISIVTLSLNSCLVDDELNQIYEGNKPIELNDGLELSTPEVENIDSELLNSIYSDVYNDESLWSLRSLLVFRNGKLVSESYLKDEMDIVNRHLIWSCTKQVMGVLTGVALEQGIINSINDPISDYLNISNQNLSEKGSITIKNMLTMRSGINYNNDGLGGQTDQLLRQLPDNMLGFILDLPMINTPGSVFNYNDGDPNLLASIIQEKTNMPTDEWADDFLFSKIGFTNYEWVRYKDGYTFGGFGLVTTPRELAKIALMVADSGRWKGQQLVSKEWILDMTSEKVTINDSRYSFGYYWWIDQERGVHFMWGHGGQFAFIIPNKNLVVLMTSIPNTQGDYQISADEALKVVDRIVKAAK